MFETGGGPTLRRPRLPPVYLVLNLPPTNENPFGIPPGGFFVRAKNLKKV